MQNFCSQCNDTVEVRIREITKGEKIRGRDIQYKGREGYCSVCGFTLFPESLEEENQALAKEAFREQEKLISIEEIEEIIKKYKIGKRPLSLLLGWGEGTLTRYIDGDLPTRQYSTTLKRIKDDPAYFEEILEDNRKAITYQAYNRSKKALELMGYATQQMTVESLCSDRLAHAAGSIIQIEPDISLDKLQILLYYLQGFHMAFWQNEMFPEECQSDGIMPEYVAIAALYPTGKLHQIRQQTMDAILDEPEMMLVETLMRWLGCYNTATIKKLMKAESARFILRGNEGTDDSADFSLENLKAHFFRIAEKYRMTSIMDIADYSLDMMHKI